MIESIIIDFAEVGRDRFKVVVSKVCCGGGGGGWKFQVEPGENSLHFTLRCKTCGKIERAVLEGGFRVIDAARIKSELEAS